MRGQATTIGDFADPASKDDGNDEALVARLRAFDQLAWGEVYDLHHTRIWRYAYARTGDRDEADDLAAQVFAEAVASIHRYRYAGRPLLAWLYRIARNLTAERARRRRREPQRSSAEPAGGSLEERLDTMELARALEALTDSQREVVTLRFFAGYTTREIAAAIGKREPAIYSLEVRALASLRRFLGEIESNVSVLADKNGPAGDIDRAI
jgi:RNA polymerase sigma-70 factor, ECF subfamily